MTKPFKYLSPFKRVKTTKQGSEIITKIQSEFDIFWKNIHKHADPSAEKLNSIRAMQEACMWLCRGAAIKSHVESEAVPEGVFRCDDKMEIDDSIGNQKPFENKPTIIVKSKKKF